MNKKLSVFSFLKNNWFLLLSFLAVRFLFLSFSRKDIIISAAVFLLSIVAMIKLPNYNSADRISARIIRWLVSATIALYGLRCFYITWMTSKSVERVASMLGMSDTVLLIIVGALLCVVGFNFISVCLLWLESILGKVLHELPFHSKEAMIANLKKNWFLPISAVAFFCLEVNFVKYNLIGLFFVFFVTLVASTQFASAWEIIKRNSLGLQLLSFACATGQCWHGFNYSYLYTVEGIRVASFIGNLLHNTVNTYWISLFFTIVSFVFVFFVFSWFWNWFSNLLRNTDLFKGIKKSELVLYSVMLLLTLCFTAVVFLQGSAFYGTKWLDVIYTSDSTLIVRTNAYLLTTFVENDLRQPLFAPFSAPFVSATYIIFSILPHSVATKAILYNSVQIPLLFLSNFMLSKLMGLTPLKRVCFMIFTTFTYTNLLSVLMMEQYIIASFWLILSIYIINTQKKPNPLVVWAAGGTLLTSLALIPFVSDKSPLEKFYLWCKDTAKYIAGFAVLMLAFCRFDVFYSLSAKASTLSGFMGKEVSFTDKILQYLAFVEDCFVAPESKILSLGYSNPHFVWHRATTSNISILGVIILVFAIISVIINRKQKIALFAGGWIVLSIIITVGFGWGTGENGLILYSLYFGWTFFVLLFLLADKISSYFKSDFILPAVTAAGTIAMCIANIPSIIDLINFSIQYYPV